MALLDTQHSLELLQKLYAVLAFYQAFIIIIIIEENLREREEKSDWLATSQLLIAGKPGISSNPGG